MHRHVACRCGRIVLLQAVAAVALLKCPRNAATQESIIGSGLVAYLVWWPAREAGRLHAELVDDDGHQQVGVGHPQHCIYKLRKAPGSVYVQLQQRRGSVLAHKQTCAATLQAPCMVCPQPACRAAHRDICHVMALFSGGADRTEHACMAHQLCVHSLCSVLCAHQ